ncbi:MAG: AfsR/SARP family transcriptional regulator [Mycobacteriales bacterium]
MSGIRERGRSATMELRLLGPMRLVAGGRPVELGPAQRRTVLAALAVDAGRPVPVDTLVDRLWDDEPPAGAHATVYAHVSHLRRMLGQAQAVDGGGPRAAVVRRTDGYVWDVDPEVVDLHRFERLVATARELPTAERADRLARALALWHGTPLGGLAGPWVARVRQRMVHQRLDAAVAWADAELRLRRPDTVIGVLRPLVTDHPLAEHLVVALMRALAGAGRYAEALDCYAASRQRLIEELGVEPGPELRRLHERLLRDDHEWSAPTTTSVRPAVPAQLPADVPGFTGQAALLGALDALLAGPGGAEPGTVVISAVSGMAGVGKTALAVHWARRIRDRFPDGQLYVNLRGFDTADTPVAPAQAIRGFLDALGVAPAEIPADPQAQAGLYRSLVADRRLLVLLDNARDTEQVIPLLPGGSGSLIVVTSRDRLSGLLARHAAHPVTVEPLTTEEARRMLAHRLGAERVAAEPAAVARIIDACGRLPLALAVAAARAAAQPAFPLTALAEELHDLRGRLDALTGGDSSSDLRAVFAASYRALSPPAAEAFRSLGVHFGPDIGLPAAASLLGVTREQARPVLAELTRAHLLTERSPSRYTLHDLLYAYATELAATDEAERRAARRRILEHYLYTAHPASLTLYRFRDPIPELPPARPRVSPEEFADDRTAAMAWFRSEHRTLVAAVTHAAAGGLDTLAWQLAWAQAVYLDLQGYWDDLTGTMHTALDAARRSGDRLGQATASSHLARTLTRQGRPEDALTHHQQALELFAQLGRRTSEARIHLSIGIALEGLGRYEDGLNHYRQALAHYRESGQRKGEAYALNNIGYNLALLGRHHEALTHFRQALELYRQVEDQDGEAALWDSMGYTHRQLGDLDQAADCYRQAAALRRAVGDRYREASALSHLGDIHHQAGDVEAARQAWQEALSIFTPVHQHRAAEVQSRLDDLHRP